MEDGKCVKMACDDGYKLVGENCEPLCSAEDEMWNQKTKKCDKAKCPPGKHLKNGECVTLTCEPGFKLDKNYKCVRFYCEEGWTMENGKCVKLVCESGYKLVGKDCQPLCNSENEKSDSNTKLPKL